MTASAPPPIDLPTVTAAADRALDRFATLVGGIPELSDRAIGTWNLHQVAAHVLGVVGAYADIARGEGSPYTDLSQVAAVNEARMAAVGDRTPYGLSTALQALRGVVADALQGPNAEVPCHGGVPVLRSIAGARILGEVVVHSWDVAAAAQRPFWIEPADAALIFRSFLPFLPRFVDAGNAQGLTARFDVRVRDFPEARAVLAFDDGLLTVEGEPQGRVDCVLSGQPGALVLVMHRRIPLRKPIWEGKLLAWGRRPWLGFRLVDMFDPP